MKRSTKIRFIPTRAFVLSYRAALPLSHQPLTFAELAAGFGVGVATAWRYADETAALLAARAPKLRKAVRDAKKAGTPT